MNNIIEKIVENKKKEVESSKKTNPLTSFIDEISLSNRDFKTEIKKKEKVNIIAEIKFSSPNMKQTIEPTTENIKKISCLYNKYADAISVITDEKYFDGSLNYLKIARQNTTIPLLRKDFIIDAYQIYEARYWGADAILLIAGILKEKELNEFFTIAKGLNMDCLFEAHTKQDMIKILSTDAEIIGINNRNLKNMEIDLNTTIQLAKEIPKDIVIVSESGIKNKKDIDFLNNANIDAVLVGTAIMDAIDKNMEEKIKGLL